MIEVPMPTEEAMRFYTSGNIVWTIQVLWSLALPALFFFTGLSEKLRTLATKIGRKWFFSLAIYLIFFIALVALISFPLSYYVSYLRLQEYGLLKMSLARWFDQFLKQEGLLIFFSCTFAWIPYLLIKKSPKKWWLYMWLISIPLLLFVEVLRPMVIDPIFNDFYPMKNKKLEKKILDLASCANIQGSRVYEVRKSADTKLMNAYVTGIGPSKKIVLWDTIIYGMDDDELLFVMAHEMGHYVLHHIWIGFAFNTALFFLVFYLLHKGGNYFAKRRGVKLYDFATIPLFILLINAISLITDPIENIFSRYIEREADRFGMELTKNGEAAARSFVILEKENLENPRPGWYFMTWRGTHPSAASRIEFFNTYHPWEEGKLLRYEHHFNKACK